MKKFFKIALWVLVALIFVGTFVYLYISSRPKVDQYEQVSPTVMTIERSTVLTGKIEPRDQIDIKPKISGIISEILVEPGDHVNNGDIIAKIKVIPEEAQLSSAISRVKSAEVALEKARLTYERTKQLYDKKYESRERYEADLAAYENARIDLAQARDQLTIVRDGVSAANAQGSNTLVRSTVTGVVLEVPVKVGSSVIQSNTFNDGTTIAKIADMNDLLFKGKVDETEVDLLTEGMPVVVSVGAIPGSEFAASVEKIAPMSTDNSGTNTFEVKAALKTGDLSKLRAGYSANARIILETAPKALSVSESVVEYSGDSAFVYVLENPGAKEPVYNRTAITTGVSDGINVQLKNTKLTEKSVLRGNIINK